MTEPGPERIEAQLLHGGRRYTRGEVAALSGVPLDRTRRIWRAMGFADVRDDERAFTDGDVEAARLLRRMLDRGLIDDERAVTLARALGQAMTRLTDWQLETLGELLADRASGLDRDEAAADAFRTTEALLEPLEDMLRYAWRRHLAAAAGTMLAGPLEEVAARKLVVGFVDLVGFTSLSSELSYDELGRLVERFETGTADRVVMAGGRVIKTLGDEVLFTFTSPQGAARLALDLVARHAGSRSMPDVRVGVATGTVLYRLGDVYGSVVNLASRLTGLAQPGSVLVDLQVARELVGDPAFRLMSVPAQSVPGFSSVEAMVLQPAPKG